MRSEAEIKAHLRDLRKLLRRPCRCRGLVARTACLCIRRDLGMFKDALEWATGVLNDYDAVVEGAANALREREQECDLGGEG
jgi:hypothetical protein